jgi:hypothetical protein
LQKKYPLCLWILLLPSLLFCETVFVKELGYRLDLPEGWQALDTSDPSKLSFSEPDRGAVLQVATFPADRSMGARAMADEVMRQMAAKGTPVEYSFSGKASCLSDISFGSRGKAYMGFLLVVKSPGSGDYVLIGFAPSESFALAGDSLLSAMDSFSPGDDARFCPGPVSQAAYPYPGPGTASGGAQAPVETTLFDGKVRWKTGLTDAKASQALVEREARLLASYKTENDVAWARFYRMIYRDCFHRIDSLADAAALEIGRKAIPREQIPGRLLAWLQGFSYSRTGTMADFLSPVSVALKMSGDCDSRGLLYVMLLHRFDFDAVLLVSSRYSHAMAGVVLDRQGAKVSWNGRQYLVAELTAKVDIGLVDREMADPSGWIPISFSE